MGRFGGTALVFLIWVLSTTSVHEQTHSGAPVVSSPAAVVFRGFHLQLSWVLVQGLTVLYVGQCWVRPGDWQGDSTLPVSTELRGTMALDPMVQVWQVLSAG